MQILSVVNIAIPETYYLRKTEKFSLSRFPVFQKHFRKHIARLSTNYQRNFQKFSVNRFFPLGKISTDFKQTDPAAIACRFIIQLSSFKLSAPHRFIIHPS
jgi:hypothetical protein